MRKFIAAFLAFVLLLGLVGCTKESQEPPKSASYTITDLLLSQADFLSRQMGMRAEEGYLNALSTIPQVISAASALTVAIDGDVLDGKMLSGTPDKFEEQVVEICGQYCGSMELAACGTLTQSTAMHFPIPLDKSTAVYLRYSDACHFVVLFKPMNNGLVSLWAYPLFADAAEQVVLRLFGDASDLSGKEIRKACEKSTKATFDAYAPTQKIDTAYYSTLAKIIFATVRPLTKDSITPYVTDSKMIQQAMDISRVMSSGIQHMEVYHCPLTAQSQANFILTQTKYRQQLKDATQQMVNLSLPNKMSNTFGVEWVALNALLAKVLQTTPLQFAAQKNERPVLILLQYRDDYTIVLSIYPTEYRTYMYSYSVMPVSFTEAQSILAKAGAKLME